MATAGLPQEGIADFDMRCFRRGFVTNVLNPKAMIFYITVFPTFIDPGRSVMVQSLAMTTLYVGIATCVHSVLVLLGDRMRPFLDNPKTLKTTRHVFSALLLGIAFWFAWSTRY